MRHDARGPLCCRLRALDQLWRPSQSARCPSAMVPDEQEGLNGLTFLAISSERRIVEHRAGWADGALRAPARLQREVRVARHQAGDRCAQEHGNALIVARRSICLGPIQGHSRDPPRRHRPTHRESYSDASLMADLTQPFRERGSLVDPRSIGASALAGPGARPQRPAWRPAGRALTSLGDNAAERARPLWPAAGG